MGAWEKGVIEHLEDDGEFRVRYDSDGATESNIPTWRLQLYEDFVDSFKLGDPVFWIGWKRNLVGWSYSRSERRWYVSSDYFARCVGTRSSITRNMLRDWNSALDDLWSNKLAVNQT
eukprot:UN03747